MSKYIYSVIDAAGNIVDEEQRQQYQDVISVLVGNGLIDEDEEITDEDVQAILLYEVNDAFQHGVDDLTDEYEFARITR